MQVRIQRTRPVVAVKDPAAPVAPVQDAVAPVARRMRAPAPLAARNKEKATQDTAQATERVKELLKSIAIQHAVIDAASASVSSSTAQIEALMREHLLPATDEGKLRAALVEMSTRQSTVVNVARFKAAVPNDVFWSCVEVPVGKAKEHLGAKEMIEVSDVTPSRSLGVSLKISEIKTVTRRG